MAKEDLATHTLKRRSKAEAQDLEAQRLDKFLEELRSLKKEVRIALENFDEEANPQRIVKALEEQLKKNHLFETGRISIQIVKRIEGVNYIEWGSYAVDVVPSWGNISSYDFQVGPNPKTK